MNDTPPDDHWMRKALDEARRAADADEVPVGAVVVANNDIVGRGHDQRIALCDPSAHAEILAMREAAQRLGDWRLEGCRIYVTLEPCAMCAGAILLARVDALYYGAANPKFGAVASRLNLLDDHGWNHCVRVEGGILADDCARLLAEFFRQKRTPPDETDV
jgi:tRNA(adenine34) deaminase